MRIIFAALSGFFLDLLLGDPAVLTPIHPVVLMGRCISALEKLLRKLLPGNKWGEFTGGLILAAVLPLGTLALCAGLLWALNCLWKPAAFILEALWCWQALAVKNLKDEAMNACRTLDTGTLEEARRAVSRIVGRETRELSAGGVTRAAVETVAENFSDGVVAPMFYMLIGGGPLALCYKAVNTMDSMVGYKNERYLWFGRAAAKLDDAANYIPARLAALLLIAAAALTGNDGKNAFSIWRRDRRKHESPNSAQCEAAMAGALHVQLCGPATYFGVVHNKPFIGDDLRDIATGDIRRACCMEYVGSALGMLLLCMLRLLILI